jgi:hypothetical protein
LNAITQIRYLMDDKENYEMVSSKGAFVAMAMKKERILL